MGARKGGEWFIEEQRFADTVIGAGVNRNPHGPDRCWPARPGVGLCAAERRR